MVYRNSHSPIAICSVIAAILFIQYYLRRQSKYLVGMGIALIMLVVSYLVEISIVTPRERVEADLYALADAFQHKEVDATMAISAPAPFRCKPWSCWP